MADGLSFERFDPANESRLQNFVDCYRDVFSTSPWFEWMKCQRCGNKWGIEEADQLNQRRFRCCGALVTEYWPTQKVEADIRAEITDVASCWVAVLSGSIIGFTIGYPVLPESIEEKVNANGLAMMLRRSFGHATLAYQNEIGVLSQHRRSGIAKELFRRRLADFRERGIQYVLTRTKTRPPTVTFEWYRRMGYSVIHEYNDADGRVILVRQLEGLQV